VVVAFRIIICAIISLLLRELRESGCVVLLSRDFVRGSQVRSRRLVDSSKAGRLIKVICSQ